jgi:hypothetical protein
MGNYNPRAPIILGEEWVPIRGDVVQFPTGDNVFEVGHQFTLLQSRTLTDARFYVENPLFTNNAQMMHIYPAGTEAESGPVQSVIIPLNAAQVTGAQISPSVSATIVTNLSNASDSNFVTFQQPSTPGVTPQYLAMFFATNSYAQQLNGKRILAVNLLYSGYEYNITTQGPIDTSAVGFATLLFLMNAQASDASPFSELTGIQNIGPNGIYQTQIGRMKLGDYTELATSGPHTPNPTEVLPWRYADLQRFEFTNAARTPLTIGFFAANASDIVKIGYAALEVVYCQEQRVAVGGNFYTAYNLGANPLTMRTLNAALNPVLAAGDYTVTVSNGDSGNRLVDSVSLTTVPPLAALRELYAIPSHPGFKINLTQTVGDVFTRETTHVLPQLSVHVSGGVLTEPHVYGDQLQAPVYGTITATQTIYDDVVSTSTPFPQVRFYARRFGSTSAALQLSSTSATVSGSSVFITPDAFDQLDEIIDGWKEVTLRFTTIPSMGGLTPDPTWTWSAGGELAGNQWQVLGATAPSISGVPGNTLSLVRSVDQLGPATYQPSAGSTTSLTWASPQVSAMAADALSDAVLIFSQDPPTITGVGVAISTQAVTGFSECSHGSCCIPTAISYHTVTWASPSGIEGDGFDRVAASSWGGGWTTSGGTASDYAANGADATITTTGSASHFTYLPGTFTDVDLEMDVTLPTLNSGGFTLALLPRIQDTSNYYIIRISTSAAGQLFLRIFRVVAGVNQFIGTAPLVTLPFAYAGGEKLTIRGQFIGGTLRAKVWMTNEDQPIDWTQSVFNETTFTTGLAGQLVSSSNTAMVMTYNRFLATHAGLYGSTFKLQRRDTLTDWQTIMSSDGSALIFLDYEARVGVQSDYRIRVCNALDFDGSWSATVSSTLTAPGVTMPSCGTNKRGLLIFTSNASQAGAYNLAYAPTWDDFPVEDFSFTEAGTVNISTQYGRDFQVAFHGTERGGEAFTRRLLLANAAVALPRLGGVHSLRDMAWADLPYVCVRDDLGDRWFAAVIVPGDEVRRNRRLYNASVTIVEVTDTAAPVEP